MIKLYIPLILLCVLAIFVVYLRRRSPVKQWKKTLNVDHHAQVFEALYQSINGYQLSQSARQHCNAIDYVYGEIEFVPFVALLSLAKPTSDTVFYDLGSGTGKAVLACAMVFPVKQAIGIEIFPTLHEVACSQLLHLSKQDDYLNLVNVVSFIQGDILTLDFPKATLLFINATTLIGETWLSLNSHIETMPSIKTVITTTKALQTPAFSVHIETDVEVSWGMVRAFVHHRLLD